MRSESGGAGYFEVMKTILVPVDFSAVTAEVTRTACQFAKMTDSRLVLLHVIQVPVVIEPYGIGAEAMVEALTASEKLATKKLRGLVRQCRQQVKTVQTIQETGHPVAVILAKLAELKADYIVIGSHGHGAVYDLLIGGTTQGVLRRAHCPVIIVPDRPKPAVRKGRR